MGKVKIKLITVGHLPPHLNLKGISKWKSGVFELIGEIENFSLRRDSDADDWVYSDVLLKDSLPRHDGADFLLAIVNVPLEDNWYSRRLGDNQIVFTFNQIKEFLTRENIPLENGILRVLYAYTLLYRRAGNKIPGFGEVPGFTHDETRGCLFDMNGIKSDLVESCNQPRICEDCVERLNRELVADQTIKSAQKEIRKIRKHLYYRVLDFVRVRPIRALLISSIFAIMLGISSSLIASYLYDRVKSMSTHVGDQVDSVDKSGR